MSQEEKKRLTAEDWDILFGDNKIQLGNTILKVKPLSLENTARIINIVKDITFDVSTIRDSIMAEGEDTKKSQAEIAESLEKAITKALPNIAVKIMNDAPDIISDILNLHLDDVKGLSMNKIVQVLTMVVSNEKELVKNCWSLVGEVFQLRGIIETFQTGEKQEQKQGSNALQ